MGRGGEVEGRRVDGYRWVVSCRLRTRWMGWRVGVVDCDMNLVGVLRVDG